MKTRLGTLMLSQLLALPSIAGVIARTPGGLTVNQPGDHWVTEVTFYSPEIVRIAKYPQSDSPEFKSYSVNKAPETVGLVYEENDSSSTVKSDKISVRADATGNVLFLSPGGDTLLSELSMSFTPCSAEVDSGKYRVTQQWSIDPDEVLLGLGQRQNSSLNQRGQDVRLWCGNTNITIPYFTSNKGYGLYWDNAGDGRFIDIPGEKTEFTSEVADGVNYYFFYDDGSQDGLIGAIRDLTGHAPMFPLWAHGFWQCRERYKSSDELCDVLDRYRELQVPLDAIVQDWQYWGCDSNWNAMKFMNPHYINKMGDKKWMRYLPNDEDPATRYPEPRIKSPREMVEYVHANNAHLMISIWANFGPWTDQYRELDKIGALYPFETWPRDRGVRPYDPFNPKARDIYWKYLKNLHDMGIDAWWTDSTEPDHFEKPGDADHPTHDGSWRSVKNAFALMTNKGIYEHQRAGGDNKRSLQMTRCGTFGIQKYGTFSWSGDVSSTWKVMKNQIPSGLNYVICGIPYWNTDIGGFFGWDYDNDPMNSAMQELQVRWMQYGCFMPLMRNHCSSPMVSEIYRFGNEGEWAYDVQKKFIKLRYRLLPYIYSAAGDVTLCDGTMMRPLMMDFATDPKAIVLDDQYMFGPSLLVKPVTDPLYTYRTDDRKGHLIYPDVRLGAAPVNVYLPAGTKWYDFWTNELHDGGHIILKATPIDVMPLYVKAGSIMPFGPDVQYSSEKPWDTLEIRIYPGADAQWTLYEDEGDGYNYEKGAYSLISFAWDDKERTLTIDERGGSYPGMISDRNFNIVLVDSSTDSGHLPATPTVTVPYDGTATSVKL